MKRYLIFISTIFFANFGKSQSLLLSADSFLKKSENTIQFIKTINKENNLTCYLINILASNVSENGNRLYVFKIFSDHFIRLKKSFSIFSQIDSLNSVYNRPAPPKKRPLINKYPKQNSTIIEFRKIKERIDDILDKDMFVKINNLSRSINDDYQMLFDNFTVQIKDSLYYFDGSVLLQYFNLMPFRQVTPLQSTTTTLNTKAFIAQPGNIPVSGNDTIQAYQSSANPEGYINYNKIYLIKINAKTNDTSYAFCRFILQSFDEYLHQTEYFTYKPKQGITKFKGIYVYKKSPGDIVMRFSYTTLEFEPSEYLTL